MEYKASKMEYKAIESVLQTVNPHRRGYKSWIRNLCKNSFESLCRMKTVDMRTIHVGDYFMGRFCSNLGMTNKTIKAAQEVVYKRSPLSIAGAVIYIVTQLCNKMAHVFSMVSEVSSSNNNIAFKVRVVRLYEKMLFGDSGGKTFEIVFHDKEDSNIV